MVPMFALAMSGGGDEVCLKTGLSTIKNGEQLGRYSVFTGYWA